MFSIDDALASIPEPTAGSAAILTIERIPDGSPQFRRLPITTAATASAAGRL